METVEIMEGAMRNWGETSEKTAMKSIPVVLAMALLLATSSEASVIGLWTFNGNTNDTSGNANHGSLMNGASLSSDVPGVLAGGQSLSLAGGNQHVLVPHNSSLDITSSMTISAWVKPVGNVGWDGVLAKNPSNGSMNNHAGNYELRIENGNRRPHFLYQRGGTNDTAFALAPTAVVPEGVWSHLAVTAQAGGMVNFYLNGTFVEGLAVETTFGFPNTNPLYIGSRADLVTTFNGFIDDVAVFDEVLTAGQIQQLANGVIIPEPSALVSVFMGTLLAAFCGRKSLRRSAR
jgi:large repetitive protein